MGSMNNPDSWAQYYTYRDCSQGICSLYCPQWCYIIFPPPPPLSTSIDDSSSPFNFSPLIISIISILAAALLLITYYTLISRYCKRRTRDRNQVPEFESDQTQLNRDHYQANSSGLDESIIKSITICKYRRADGLITGTECSVCLSEFQEDESLRLLPKCNHSFHVHCIDTWLKSHSNCPLCRANLLPTNPNPDNQNSTNTNVSSLQIHRQNDAVLAVEDPERENVIVPIEDQQERSNFVLVADILRIGDEDDEASETRTGGTCSGIGSSSSERIRPRDKEKDSISPSC